MKTFDVIAKMVNENNLAVKIAPLNYIKDTQQMKDGTTRVTIIVADPQFTTNLVRGELLGGLLYIDRKEFEAEARLMGELPQLEAQA